jgi:hypothetical protein
MDLSAVLAELETRLKTITGLRTSVGFSDKINAPEAVVLPPDTIRFDGTYGRGMDYYDDVQVVLAVGRPNPRSALAAIAPYLAGSGSKSIKAKLDDRPGSGYASCSTVTVERAELDDTAQLGGATFLAAIFHINITGPGA